MEVTWVCHGLNTRSRTSRASIRRASPLPTHGDIKDQIMAIEMRWNVAVCGREEGKRSTPTTWLRGPCSDVRGNRRSGEKINSNPVRGQQMSIYAPTSAIEAVPVALSTIAYKCTATIITTCCYTIGTNLIALSRTGSSLRHGATITSMEGHLVCSL